MDRERLVRGKDSMFSNKINFLLVVLSFHVKARNNFQNTTELLLFRIHVFKKCAYKTFHVLFTSKCFLNILISNKSKSCLPAT